MGLELTAPAVCLNPLCCALCPLFLIPAPHKLGMCRATSCLGFLMGPLELCPTRCPSALGPQNFIIQNHFEHLWEAQSCHWQGRRL